MNVRIIRGTEVSAPTTTPLGSSVLDHATVKETNQFGLRNDEGLWPSYNCLDTLVPTPICPDPTMDAFRKTFSFIEWQPAFAFAVHGGVQCKALGLDQAEQEREVSRVFAANEGRGVEEALLRSRFVADSGPSPLWGSPVSLTATAVPLPVALAMLEGYAASTYAGVPTIHMSRAAASLLNERIVWEGGKAYTRNGSKVAIGGGYEAGYDATFDGKFDLYATGEVFVERSSTITQQSIVLPGEYQPGSDGSPFEENSVITLAERMYRVAIDCFVAKATGAVKMTL